MPADSFLAKKMKKNAIALSAFEKNTPGGTFFTFFATNAYDRQLTDRCRLSSKCWWISSRASGLKSAAADWSSLKRNKQNSWNVLLEVNAVRMNARLRVNCS